MGDENANFSYEKINLYYGEIEAAKMFEATAGLEQTMILRHRLH